MKILIDIGHPAHVHYFRNFIKIMKEKGHEFIIIARTKPIIFHLLNYYKVDFIGRGKGKTSLQGKLFYLLYANSLVFYYSLKFKPNIYISQGGVYTSFTALFFNKPNLVLEDTENATYSHKIANAFNSLFIHPSCFNKKISNYEIRYAGVQEMLYLHPKYYKPNIGVSNDLGIDENDKYVIVRFVSWDAHHDIGLNGITLINKIKLVKMLSHHAKVFITSEKQLPEELEPYKISIPPEKMHDAIYYSSLLVGESATMASEAAVLGIPSIYIDEVGRGYTDEEGKVGLVYNYKPAQQEEAIMKSEELIKLSSLKKYQQLNKQFLNDKIDVSEFLVWFVENFPESFKIMKENPVETQKRFL